MKILVVNAGSSSYKLALYEWRNQLTPPLWHGSLDWGQKPNNCSLEVQANGQKIQKEGLSLDQSHYLKMLIETMWKGETQVIEDKQEIKRIGHRVVHGGSKFQRPTLITKAVKEDIRECIPLAPLHNPANLEGIEQMEKLFPSVPQIAVFDTAFHSHMPEVAKTYPLPYEWRQKGIQRYGFHGISHHYCAYRISRLLRRDLKELKIINCHLGNGASLCAIENGISVNTTMGFTPLEGLMMGSRSGSIDPGILFYLMRENQYTSEELDHILNFESGLKGICDHSDMREVLADESQRGKLAFQMHVYHLRFYIGALLINLGPIDVLSFTAGVGENSAPVREAACQDLEFLGIELDMMKNRSCKPDQDIALKHSKTRVFVIHTQEEWMIAKQCFALKLS